MLLNEISFGPKLSIPPSFIITRILHKRDRVGGGAGIQAWNLIGYILYELVGLALYTKCCDFIKHNGDVNDETK